VLENFHKQYIEGSLLPYNIAITDAFRIAWSQYKNKMTPEMKKMCWDMTDQYLRMVTKDKQAGKKFRALSVEKRFEVRLAENVTLNGAIDRIDRDDDDVPHVIDYKTSKTTKYLKSDWFQLLTYAYVLHQEDPTITKVRGSYIMLKHNFEALTKEFNLKEILTIGDKFQKYAEQIRNETEFAPNPTALCPYCSFLEHCEAGKARCSGNSNICGEVSW
jgi:RecB family exonuclease